MANHSLRALTTSAAPPALAVATVALSHENTDHARRFESITAEFAAAAGFAAGFATPGRHSESGRSGSERPRSQLHEHRLVASKEVPVLGEIPAASIAGNQTSLQKRSCDNSLRNLRVNPRVLNSSQNHVRIWGPIWGQKECNRCDPRSLPIL